MNEEMFPRRVLIWWLGAAGLVFLCSFYFMTRDNSKFNEPDITGPSTNSKSAIGYAAVYRMLEKLGVKVAQGHEEDAGKQPAGDDIIVIAEPDTERAVLTEVKKWIDTAPTVLLILPKRRGTADEIHPGRLAEDDLVEGKDVAQVLGLVDHQATFGRYSSIQTWRVDERFPDAPTIKDPQLIQSKKVTPLVSAPEGILVGEIREGNCRLVVVSDPDWFANHGLGKGRNATEAYRLIRALLAGSDGRVVFEESIHGFVSTPEHTAMILFKWPFVLVTIQIAVAAALLIWASAARFGAPQRLPPPLGTGKASLVESGSRLLATGGHVQFLTEKYVDAAARDVSIHLHAPPTTDMAVLRAWLGRTGRPLPLTAATGNSSRAAIAEARQVHRWRRKVLSESRIRTKNG
jgi:hypothetical protein